MEIFKKMGLNDALVNAVAEMGFTEPTPIQAKTIPLILNSKDDLVALAQTGTGKTAAFGLPVLQKTTPGLSVVQTLILCPTRELCLQITSEIEKFSKYIKGFKVVAVYGGANIVNQMKDLKKGVQMVVGTPGRTLDLKKRGALKVDHIEWLVLDEADEMLNMGFKEDLDAILSTTPAEKQTLLFSATMPNGVMRIAQTYMHNPVEISAGQKNIGAENVEHRYYMVKSQDKYKAIKRIADINPDIYGIVFCRTRQETKDLAHKLVQDGYNAGPLHGDLSQSQRDEVMSHFRQRHLRLLVATDVAARGLDVNDLTHIINYSLPDDPEVYIHRSGRTGRAGKNGISIAIIHTREKGKLNGIEKLARIRFHQHNVPDVMEISKKRLFGFIEKMEKVDIGHSQVESFLPEISKKLEWMDKDELINRFITLEFQRFLEYYKNEGDINVNATESRKESREGKFGKESYEKRKERPNKGFSRFFINIGSKQNIKAHNLIGLINDCTGSSSIEIGKIEILGNFSFFEVEKSRETEILESMNNASFGQVKLKVEPSVPKKGERVEPAEKTKRREKSMPPGRKKRKRT
jgi:ATP-dependent RNA helicase DeaD